jgi:hypothetical protein
MPWQSGAPDETILSLAGRLDLKMLKHYNHIRIQAKRNRKALESLIYAFTWLVRC